MNFIVGVDDFGQVIERQFNFIDKSLFIKEILDNDSTAVTVITRPRRFGKTLNMSMLHHFLAAEVNGLKTEGMFDHLNISQCGPTYMDQQGKYPVISVSFKSVFGSYAESKACFGKLMSQLYEQHFSLLSSAILHPHEKATFERILNEQASEVDLTHSLLALSGYLYRFYGVKPWILIDEYDTPIQSGYTNKHYEQMIHFMRSVLGNALKGNPHLHRAVVTGILRISQESLFSQLNNIAVMSILNAKYATCFGFTQTEVDNVLKKFNLGHLSSEVKTWYNGYHIGAHQMYNPWSIASCINQNGVTGPYWVNTSGYDLIKTSMASAGATAKEQFERILQGESIEQTIDEHMVFGNLKTNTDAVWSLLLFSGYLTVIEKIPVDTRIRCILRTPNEEIAALYRDIIREWFGDRLGEVTYHALLEALVTGQFDEFLEKLKQFLMESMSYFDTQGHHPENFYHGFVLGLMVSLAETHTVQSNRESGYGRYDVMLIPKDPQQLGLILEFKVAKKDVALIDAAQEALVQINSRAYETELRQRNIQKIAKVGLAFRDKDVEMAIDFE